jgi:FkbM family methyltransferase
MDVIFDLGANRGLNVSYYLLKADRVIAVEANPELCEVMNLAYANEISSGKLKVVNAVIVDEPVSENKYVEFYISKSNDVLSQIAKPESEIDFRKVQLPSISVEKLFNENVSEGDFITHCKIDLEGFDYNVMKAMFDRNIFPNSISIECHEAKSFALLLNSRKYVGFKLVDGSNVSQKYGNCKVYTSYGELVPFSFKEHSAGPFGDDISGEWHSENVIFEMLGVSGLGWKDVCATMNPDKVKGKQVQLLIANLLFKRLVIIIWRRLMPSSLRSVLFRIRKMRKIFA